jgi:hypothetical protein
MTKRGIVPDEFRCTATSKQQHRRCKRRVTPGRTVCHIHGGKTPRGIASPKFKHGKQSLELPARLISDYQAALADPDYLVQKEQIALLRARLNDLLRRVDTGESGGAWNKAQESYRAIVAALQAGDSAALSAALKELDGVIGRGVSDYGAWKEVHATLETQRRTIESEQKRITAASQTMTAQQAMALIAGIMAVIRDNVSDMVTLERIRAGIMQLTNRPQAQITEGE